VTSRTSPGPRVFCVHSRARPLQARFYADLQDSLQGLDISLTQYEEWSWETPGGIPDEEVRRQKESVLRRHREGYEDVEGFEWLQNPPPEISILPRKERVPAPPGLNERDLSRLIRESHCIVMVEDEHQGQLSSGVTKELALLDGHDKRVLSVRLFARREDAYQHSIYPGNVKERLNGVIGIGVSVGGEVPPEDMELVTFILSSWCDDIGGSTGVVHEAGAPRVVFDAFRHSASMEARGLYRYKTALRLSTSDRDHIRYAALLHMTAARDQNLRLELCRHLVSVFTHDGPWQTHLHDFFRFMELTPDLDWNPVIKALNRSLMTNENRVVADAQFLAGLVIFAHTPFDSHPRPVEEELKQRLCSIPRWTVVALAASWARSSWNMHSWPGMSRRQATQLKETIDVAQRAATERRLPAGPVISRSSVDMFQERLAGLAIAAIAAAAFASCADSLEVAGRAQSASELDEGARRVVSRLVSNAFSEHGVKEKIKEVEGPPRL